MFGEGEIEGAGLVRYPGSAFLFFLWPVMILWYLPRTRRWRGAALAVLVIVVHLLPYWVGYAVYVTLSPYYY